MTSRVTNLPVKYRELKKKYHKVINAIMMNRVTNLPDKYRELRKEYHKVSSTIMINRVTNLSDKYRELRKESSNHHHIHFRALFSSTEGWAFWQVFLEGILSTQNDSEGQQNPYLASFCHHKVSNTITMNRVTNLPDKYIELRKEYHKVSNTIMMNWVTNMPDKYRELRKEYHNVGNTIMMNSHQLAW